MASPLYPKSHKQLSAPVPGVKFMEKDNQIFALTISVVAILFALALYFIKNAEVQSPRNQAEVRSSRNQTELDDFISANNSCSTTSECARVSDACSCSCGSSINISFLESYRTLRTDVCNDYWGPICKMQCPEQELACIDNTCQLVSKNLTSQSTGTK